VTDSGLVQHREDESDNAGPVERWARVLVCVALILAVIGLLAPGRVHAHDWKRPDLDNWYSNLQATGKGTLSAGTPCCSKTDCHTTEAELRRGGKDGKGEWWARLGTPKSNGDWDLGPWVRVPDEVIVRGPSGNPVTNEAGEAVICHPIVQYQNMIQADKTVVYCFVPPNES
jgi:hypothetical protein